METRLREALAGVEVTEPVATDTMQVFGLRWALPDGPPYQMLDEALAAGTLEVTEIDAGGSVPEIKVINKAERRVFLMAGEQLIGAKQNRVVNASMMVPARDRLTVPVSCVEAGRWGYRSPKFRSGGTASHPKLRRMMSRQVALHYGAVGEARSDQGAVWDEVSRKLHAMGSHSPSAALEQAYVDRHAGLERATADLRLPEDCCGAAFVFGGRVVGVELFDRPGTLAKVLPKLIRAYALDALEEAEWHDLSKEIKARQADAAQGEAPEPPDRPGPVDRAFVEDWLRSAAGVKSQVFDSPGLGQDIRFEDEDLVGASLLVEDRPVHTELFSGDR